MAPQFHELCTRQKWMLSFTSDHLTGENLPDTLWIRVWVGPTVAGRLWKKENLFRLPVIGPGFLGRLVYSPVTLPSKLSSWVMNYSNRMQDVIFIFSLHVILAQGIYSIYWSKGQIRRVSAPGMLHVSTGKYLQTFRKISRSQTLGETYSSAQR